MFDRNSIGVSLRALCRVVDAKWAAVLLGLLLAGCDGSSLGIGNPNIDVETGDTNVDVTTNVDQTQDVTVNVGDSESPTAVVEVSPSEDVSRGQEVRLDASASTPGTGGGSLSFVWSEVTGFGIVIRDATTAVATAEIPLDVDDNDTIVIRVQVSAGQRADTTEVRLTVVGGAFESDDACEGVSCGQDQTCNPATGVCVDDSVDQCADITCDENQTCNPATGRCDDDDLCAAVTCPAGEVCDTATGMCEFAAMCVGVTCAAGQTCDADTGDCISATAVIFVDADAPAGGDGSSWATAFDDIHAALAEAVNLGGSFEIWVARGTYTPAGPGGDRGASFNMLNNVELLGGFAGTETTRSQRDIAANETILSGDLDGDDLPAFLNRNDNSFQVLKAVAVADTAVLDGFTIQGGSASDPTPANHGAGLFATDNASPVVLNCLFRDNEASEFNGVGGAMSGLRLPGRVENCVFTDNRASQLGGAAGAVFANVIDCMFSNNHAGSNGGAIWNGNAVGCTFVNNSADNFGGAVSGGSFSHCRFLGNTALDGGAGEGIFAVNCEFSGNHADSVGGAIASFANGATVANSTFSNNTAVDSGGAIWNAGTVANCILWGNTDSTGATESAQIQTAPASNSLIQGLSALAGDGNISLNPQFVDPLGPDGIAGTLDDDLRLMSNSPAIDAGDNASLLDDTLDVDGDGDLLEATPLDLDGTARVQNGTVDMGAYEITP